MNDQELGNIIDKCSRNAIKSYIKHNYTFNKLIKQDQALREIDIRIDELKNICDEQETFSDDFDTNQAVNIKEFDRRIAELQSQKDKLMEASK